MKSEECMKSEMDLFSLPSYQASVENGVWFKKESDTSNPGTSGDIIFKIDRLANEYIDLSESYLKLLVSIRKENETDTTQSVAFGDNEKVGPINNFFSLII